MKIVSIDASAAASWLFVSQKTQAADDFLADSAERNLVAPDIFAWEIGNQIGIRSRSDRQEAERLLVRLESFRIEIASPISVDSVFARIPRALERGLTLFDMAYLDHALSHGSGLASRDRRLLDAARAVGVDVFDLRD